MADDSFPVLFYNTEVVIAITKPGYLEEVSTGLVTTLASLLAMQRTLLNALLPEHRRIIHR